MPTQPSSPANHHSANQKLITAATPVVNKSTRRVLEPFYLGLAFVFVMQLVVACFPASAVWAGYIPPLEATPSTASSNAVASELASATAEDKTRASAASTYGKLPLRFEVNQGQTANSTVKYLARGKGYNLFFTPDKAVLALRKNSAADKDYQPKPADCNASSASKANNGNNKARDLASECRLTGPAVSSKNNGNNGNNKTNTTEQTSGIALALELTGARPTKEWQLEPQEELLAKTNYFLGSKSSDWKTGIASYGRLAYRGVYPGIDLTYYGTEKGTLEYDFVVSPGANPAVISVKLAGAEKLALAPDNNGDLVVTLVDNAGELRLVKPTLYQTNPDGTRQSVTGSYKLTGNNKNEFGFTVGQYDTTRPLTIDPVLSYSTYLGGAEIDEAVDVAVDSAGYLYILGQTTATDFPTSSGSYQTTPTDGLEMFVTKVNSTTSAISYSTYLRSTGAGDETPAAIEVNSLGQAYIVGTTASSSFPTTGSAYQTTAPTGSATNAFVTILNATGTGLVYSSYLGGTGTGAATTGLALALYPASTATPTVYIGGATSSTTFPVTGGAYQTTNRGGTDGYLARLNPQVSGTSSLTYATYYGGTATDEVAAIGVFNTVTRTGQVAVAGLTNSLDISITTATAFQTALANPASGEVDALVAVLDPASSGSSALKYASYYGGSSADEVSAATIDTNGKVYLLGTTNSSNLTTTSGVVQNQLRGGQDAFVIKVDPDASGSASLSYATYFGGSNSEGSGTGITVGGLGGLTIAGWTNSSDLTTTATSYQPASAGGVDGFVVFLNPTATSVSYGTFLGGSGNEEIGAMVSAGGILYVAGSTTSANFPLKSYGISPTLAGGTDAFVSAIGTGGTGAADLKYSTLLGGSNVEEGLALTVDATGAAYVVGHTYSTDFPVTTGSYQTLARKGGDGYVAKLNPTGSGLVYATYLGGSGYDNAKAVTVDSSGNAYIVGETASTDFPISSTLQTTNRGDLDLFAVRLNPAGSAIGYATYLGGNSTERAVRQIAVDSSGRLHLGGHTASSNYYSTTGNLGNSQPITVGNESTFATVINPAGTAISYSLMLGGNSTNYDSFRALALDKSGNMYLVGETASPSFPGPGGSMLSTSAGTGAGVHDSVLVKLNPGLAGTASLVHTTLLGGTGDDVATRLALDESVSPPQLWVTGYTKSTNFPTAGSGQLSSHGAGRTDYDSFVLKHNMSTSGSGGLSYSTYLGGTANDFGYGIGLGSDGKDVFVVGTSSSSDLPTTPGAFQGVYGGVQDAYLARVKADASSVYSLTYATYLGGSKNDDIRSLAVLTPSLSVYVAGISYSQDWPVTAAALQTNLAGGSDSVVARFNFLRLAVITQPTTTALNTPISPAVGVAVQNLDGSTYPSYTGSVVASLALNTGTPGATLGGTLSQGVTGGVATFSNLTLDKLGTGYTLKFGSANNLLEPISSASFDTVGGANNRYLTLIAGSPQSVVTWTNFVTPFKVRLTDYLGYPQAGVVVTFTAPTSGASGTFNYVAGGIEYDVPTYSTTTDGSGYATAVMFHSNSTVGSYTVVATASGVASPVSFQLTNLSPPVADYLDYTLKLEPALSSPNPLSSTVVLTATLFRHAVVTVTNVPINLSFSAGAAGWPGAPTLSGSSQNASGQWIFTYTRTVTATDNVLASAVVSGVTIYSANSAVYWLKPLYPVGLDNVQALFYQVRSYNYTTTISAGDVSPVRFADYVSDTPVFSKTFPSLIFNPPLSVIASSTVTENSKPLTSVSIDSNGTPTGYNLAENPAISIGRPVDNIPTRLEYEPFVAVFMGNFVVEQEMTATFNVWNDDNLVIGVGPNKTGAAAIRIHDDNSGNTNIYDDLYVYEYSRCLSPQSGTLATPPTNVVPPTALLKLPLVAARNCNWYGGYGPGSAGYTLNYTFTIYFPEPGLYPYELNFYEHPYNPTIDVPGGGQLLAIPQLSSSSVTGTFTLHGAQGILKLTPSTLTAQASGLTQTQSLTATLTSPNGTALGSGITVTLFVEGANGLNGGYARSLVGQTDGTGVATFSYTGTNPGVDYLSAVAWLNGVPAYSTNLTKLWNNPPEVVPPGGKSGPTPGQGCSTEYNWLATPTNRAQLASPSPLTLASGITLGNGTVVQLYPVTSPYYSSMITLANSLGAVAAGDSRLLPVTLDPTLLANGSYILRLAYTDGAGVCHSNLTLVNVVGENKPGRVAFDVTDFTVPVAGMPIVVGRTYDSLERNTSGDFGYGWNLSISSPKLEVNPAGDVTLTTLDGKRVTYFFTPGSSVFGFGEPAYTAEAGVYGSLTSNGCGAVAAAGSAGGYLCFPGGRYNPDSYSYRDAYGRVYVISRASASAPFKLTSLTDLNGNTLSFSDTGIKASNLNGSVSSSNIVTISRDITNSNRITAITGPDGKVYSYSYAPTNTTGLNAGDLEKVTLPQFMPGTSTNISLTYSYHTTTTATTDYRHLFLAAKDPRGNTAATTSYDGNGRLAKVTQPVGSENYITSYGYDLANNTTVITSPDGGVTSSKTDGYGKVISQAVDIRNSTSDAAKWQVSQSSYDANRNLEYHTLPVASPGDSPRVVTYTYNARGQQEQVHDALGNPPSVTSFNHYGGPVTMANPKGETYTVGYDQNFMPTQVSDNLGYGGGYVFDARGSILSRLDGNGKATTFEYDQYGNKKKETDPLQNSSSFDYDTMGRVITATDPFGVKTVNQYDGLGRLVKTTAAYGTAVQTANQFEYDSNGNRIASIDSLLRRTEYTYDTANRLLATKYPDGTTTRSLYDWRGSVISQTDQLGRTTLSRYDLAGQLVSMTVAFGTTDAATTVYEYDGAGRKVREYNPYAGSSSLPGGQPFVKYEYDAGDRLITTTDQLGNSSVYTYDIAGRKIASRDAKGNVTDFAYDERGRLITTTNPATIVNGQSVRTANSVVYDTAGRLKSRTDEAGKTTLYTYLDTGWLQSVSIPLTQAQGYYQKTSYEYDKLGRLTAIVDANTNRTEFKYDELGRQSRKTWADQSFESWEYDAGGNMRKHRLADGNTNSYDYDLMGRLSKASYFDGKTVVYTYTLSGQRQQVQDYRGITSYSYDNRDRVRLVTPPVGAAATSVGYNYDVMGNRTWLTATLATTSTVFTTQYGYDAAYRVLAVTDSASPQPLYYEYDAVGNRTKLTLPTTANSTVVTYTYDALNRLTGIRQGMNLQPTALAQYTYTLGASGNREQVVEARNGAPTTIRTWSYDDGYRLLTEVRQDTGFSAITTAYNYDKTGNRLRQSVTNGASPALVTNYTYNELDQLTSVISGSLTTGYSYDRRGNLLQMGSGSGATSYRWDALDRLTVITTPGGTLTYEYDAGGKRIKQVAGGVTTNYLWDEFSPYGDVLLEIGASGQFGARYALAGGELLSQKRSDGAFSYYLKDGQGSVRSLLSQSGSVTDQYDYTAFGEIASRTGSTINPYQYTRQQYDALSGLYSLRARYYNPAQGRFLSKDTYPVNRNMPQELNRYGYVANNPLNLVDPSGLQGVAEAAKPNPSGNEYAGLLLQTILQVYGAAGIVALGLTAVCLIALDISLLINAFGGDGSLVPVDPKCKTSQKNPRCRDADVYGVRNDNAPDATSEENMWTHFEITVSADEPIKSMFGNVDWNNADRGGKRGRSAFDSTTKLTGTGYATGQTGAGHLVCRAHGIAYLLSGKACEFDTGPVDIWVLPASLR